MLLDPLFLQVFLFQVRQVSKAVEVISGNRFVSCAVTFLVSCATYPLTNLYNRGAVTEFLSVSLVISVCMMWLRMARMDDPRHRRRLLFSAALALVFAMGTHPITAVLGSCMVGFAVLASLPLPQLSATILAMPTRPLGRVLPRQRRWGRHLPLQSHLPLQVSPRPQDVRFVGHGISP